MNKTINKYLKDYQNKIDILVLGCTHYPIIKEDINKYFNNQVKLLDMSELLLDKLNNDNTSSITIYYSKLNDTIINNTKKTLDIENLNIYTK